MNYLRGRFTATETWLQSLTLGFIIPLGFIGGLTLGAIARLWMRWISTDPEFTWSGSIFIVIAFAIFCTAHSSVFFAKRKSLSRRSMTIARIGAIPFSLPIFTAAGGVMLPTVIAGSLAIWRKRWPKWVRIILGVVSIGIPVYLATEIVGDFGWSIATIGRILLFAFIYAVVVAITQPTVAESPGGKRLSRTQKIVIGLALLVFIGTPVALAVGFS